MKFIITVEKSEEISNEDFWDLIDEIMVAFDYAEQDGDITVYTMVEDKLKQVGEELVRGPSPCTTLLLFIVIVFVILLEVFI